MNQICQAQLEITENVIAGLLKNTDPELIAIALNNVCRHGTVFIDGPADDYLDDDDKFLGEWFEGIEKLQAACKNARKRS